MRGPVKAKQFLDQLRADQLEATILLLGSDLYWRDALRTRLVNAFAPQENPEWAVTRISLRDSSLDKALLQARTLPLLASRQVIFVDALEALEHGAEEIRLKLLDQLAHYVDQPASFTLLVLEAAVLDRRATLFRLLRERATIVELASAAGPDIATIVEMAHNLGARIDEDAARLLADLVGNELARIHTELSKLVTYVGEHARITPADIKNLVPPSENRSVWELTEVLACGPRSRVLQVLDSLLRRGDSGPKLIGAFAWTYRKLLEAQDLPPRITRWEAARQLSMRVDTIDMVLRQARRIPRTQLVQGLVALAEADNQLKSSGVNQRVVLEFLVMQLTAHLPPGSMRKTTQSNN